MAALKNQRQERFCQLVKQGIPPFRAYPQAGYAANNASPYQLLDNPRVKRRLAELTKSLAMKTRVTVESLTAELNEAIELAKRTEQPAAITQAIQVKGKLHGLLIDRKESGSPGDFANLKTRSEVLDAVRTELGEAAAKLVESLTSEAETVPETPSEPEISPDQLPKPGDIIN